MNRCEPVKQKLTVRLAAGVDGDLQMSEQGRRVLDLIHDDGRRVAAQKRIGLQEAG